MSSDGFLIKGVTMACLNLSGKTPSASDRLIMQVIGGTKALRQDFIILVGIVSRRQVASEEERISLETSLSVQGVNSVSDGIGSDESCEKDS